MYQTIISKHKNSIDLDKILLIFYIVPISAYGSISIVISYFNIKKLASKTTDITFYNIEEIISFDDLKIIVKLEIILRKIPLSFRTLSLLYCY